MNLAIFLWWARLLTPKIQVRDFDGNMFAYNIPETVLIINCDLLPHPFVSNDGFIRPIFCLILRHTFSRIIQDYYFNFQINSSNFFFRNFNLIAETNVTSYWKPYSLDLQRLTPQKRVTGEEKIPNICWFTLDAVKTINCCNCSKRVNPFVTDSCSFDVFPLIKITNKSN